MNKRWLIGLGIVIPLLAAAVYLDPTCTLQGILKRDSFYRARPTTYWRKALSDPMPTTQVETLKQLKEGGSAALPVLVELLREEKNSDWEAAKVRWLAAEILGQLGADAQAAVPTLAEALKDHDAHVRAVAAAALGDIGPAAKEAVPELIEMLKTGGTEERLNAA